MNYTELKLRALIAINEIRLKRGVSTLAVIPRGYQRNSEDCPLYRALVDCGIISVGVKSYSTENEELEMPTVLIEFVRAVDAGMFPELSVA